MKMEKCGLVVLMDRECGDCNLCWKLPNIDNSKFKKDYTWCKHCEIGLGCKIYSDRPKMCKDFVCAWLLGLTPEEMAENERLWREENDATTQAKPTTSATELRSAGVSTAGIQADLDAAEPEAPATEPGDEGAGTPGAGTPPDAGTTTPGT